MQLKSNITKVYVTRVEKYNSILQFPSWPHLLVLSYKNIESLFAQCEIITMDIICDVSVLLHSLERICPLLLNPLQLFQIVITYGDS